MPERKLIYADTAVEKLSELILLDDHEKKVLESFVEKCMEVDAVEVVRCKDCRFSAQHDIYDPMECVKWATKWGVAYTTPDGYCHKGERKDNAKESNDLARSN